jgi:hypothetical protein
MEYELESEAGMLLVVDRAVEAPLAPGTAVFAELAGSGVCLVPA